MIEEPGRIRPAKKGVFAAVAAIFLSGVLAGPITPSDVAGAATGCGTTWSLVPGPTSTKSLNGVAAVSANDVWAVGLAKGGTVKTVTEHWDGASWSLVSSPNIGSNDNGLNGAAAVSSGDVWAVGYTLTGAVFQTLTEHWNGATWSVVPSPSPGSSGSSLVAASAVSANDVWAVGYALSDIRRTLIEHWNGTSWSVVTSQDPGTASNGLLGVAAVSANNVWAVGYQSDGYGYRTLVEHWNGTSWSVVPSQDPGTGDRALTGSVAVSANDVWAVGYFIDGARNKTLTEHWDGSAWSVVPSPNPGSSYNVLRAVAAVSTQEVWAVGFYYKTNAYSSLIEEWDGSSWNAVASQNGSGSDPNLIGVGVAPDTGQVWATGRAGGAFRETNCPTTTGSVALRGGRHAPNGGGGSAGAFGSRTVQPPPLGTTRQAVPQTVVAVDEAASAGIYESTRTHGAAIGDYNGDGWPDIFLGRHQGAARLYSSNHNGSFTEIDAGTFGHHDRHGCAWGDVNRDGLPDVFCAAGADRGSEVKRNELWIQQSDHSFVDQGVGYGVLDPFGRGRIDTFIDANGDGYPDLFLGNYFDRPDGIFSPNRLLINVGGTYFRDASEIGLDQEASASCLQVADYNNDGWQDLLACNRSSLKLYRNDAGAGFTDVTASAHLAHHPTDARFGDMNGDGSLDVVETTRGSLKVELQQSGVFQLVYKRSLDAGIGVSIGDVNGDGRPDLYVVQASGATSSNMPDLMLLNGGDGKSFTEMTIPETDVGNADEAVPIDYDRNGLTDFLVLNGGAKVPGPVQLIAFFPA